MHYTETQKIAARINHISSEIDALPAETPWKVYDRLNAERKTLRASLNEMIEIRK